MACISSAEPQKEKSSDDQVAANKKMVVEEKGTGVPKWHIIKGIKLEAGGSKYTRSPGGGSS
ncbi:hypothetical protein ACOSQ4_009265 [Xanthoceras sorbifolium]